MLGFLNNKKPKHALFRQDGREGNRAQAKKKKPSLFDRFLQEEKAAAAAISSSNISSSTISTYLSDIDDDDDDDDTGAPLPRLTYVGFSVPKIRQELFQSWLTDQPDAAQYRCADLVSCGAVAAVFQELFRIACVCVAQCPKLLIEVAHTQRQMYVHFDTQHHNALLAKALKPGFGGANFSSSCSMFNEGGKKRKKAGSGGVAQIAGGGKNKNIPWILYRNEMVALRQPLSRLVLLAYLAVDESVVVFVPPPFVPVDEYVRARLEQHTEADRSTWAQAVLRHDDSVRVTVATNELVYHLMHARTAWGSPAGQRQMNAVCYWIQWLAYRAASDKKLVCAERQQFAGNNTKIASQPVWIVWEAMYYASRNGGGAVSAMLDVLSAEFQRGYSTGTIKQRMHFLFCAARITLFGADWDAPLASASEAAAADFDRRVEFDADTAYRVLQMEKAKVDAAKEQDMLHKEIEMEDGYR